MAEILYFGRLTDATGTPGETISLPASVQDTNALRHWLDAEKALDGALLERTVRIAINSEIVGDTHPVRDSDEIALMPPVGGG
ncbi:MAG: molybdopterin converting factor subunit 1 [Henriciella sp.]|uniref:molybdopterin converting factor subunit 1 n=1 Tax=Henriciella sp. TaxID=1968823 RepID=UPI003C7274AC